MSNNYREEYKDYKVVFTDFKKIPLKQRLIDTFFQDVYYVCLKDKFCKHFIPEYSEDHIIKILNTLLEHAFNGVSKDELQTVYKDFVKEIKKLEPDDLFKDDLISYAQSLQNCGYTENQLWECILNSDSGIEIFENFFERTVIVINLSNTKTVFSLFPFSGESSNIS